MTYKKLARNILLSIGLFSFFLTTEHEDHLRLFVTSDVKSETEPCGWKKKPAGGLARKSTIVNNSRNAGFNTVVLDAGNLFFKQNAIDPGVSLDVAKETAFTILESFNLIGCDGFSPGQKDYQKMKHIVDSV